MQINFGFRHGLTFLALGCHLVSGASVFGHVFEGHVHEKAVLYTFDVSAVRPSNHRVDFRPVEKVDRVRQWTFANVIESLMTIRSNQVSSAGMKFELHTQADATQQRILDLLAGKETVPMNVKQ